MNFLDTYDITGSNTPPPGNPEKSLNEEVNEVVGQLGRLWGGFRKQSQSAFAGVVSQAQKAREELNKLAAEPSSPTSPSSPEAGPSTSTRDQGDTEDQPAITRRDSTSSSDSGSTIPASPPSGHQRNPSLLSRLQASLPPNVVAAVQNNLPDSVRHAATDGIDFAQLRASLTTEFQRVQGLTRAQAEEYMHKGEDFLKEAMKEASEALKDAVKVIPPEEQRPGEGNFVLGTTDVWMLPDFLGSSSAIPVQDSNAASSSGKASADATRAVATRAESLLKRLKENPEVIKIDPTNDEAVRPQYEAWVAEQLGDKEELLQQDKWREGALSALSHEHDGETLNSTLDQLVPSHMTEDTFWRRYFFRVHQIELDEKKRKALLQGTLQNNEEVFSWEDEDSSSTSGESSSSEEEEEKEEKEEEEDEEDEEEEEESPSNSTEHATPTTTPAEIKKESSQTLTPANTSPRESVDSYDVVSATSANASVKGDTAKSSKEESDEDDDDEEEEDGEEEDESGSDWE